MRDRVVPADARAVRSAREGALAALGTRGRNRGAGDRDRRQRRRHRAGRTERWRTRFFVKGPYYGATLATCLDEAIAAYHRAVAAWGGPVILQAACAARS